MGQDAIMKTSAYPTRRWLACICLCFTCVTNSLAAVDICQEPAADSHLSFAYYQHEKSSIGRGPGETRQENHNIDLQIRSNDKWAFGAGHQYTILNADQLDLQTNGHLHTFFLPMHRMSQAGRKAFRFSIAPALSASSNVMKDPDQYDADALQLLAALVWSREVSDQVGVRYGICGDHRFGRYRIYPLISVDLQPHPDWMIELGFPVSRLGYQISKSLASLLRAGPDGNEWHVSDRSLERKSQLVYEAFIFEWALIWQAHEHFVLTASVGSQFHNRFEMTLLNDSRERFSGETVTRIGAAITWNF